MKIVAVEAVGFVDVVGSEIVAAVPTKATRTVSSTFDSFLAAFCAADFRTNGAKNLLPQLDRLLAFFMLSFQVCKTPVNVVTMIIDLGVMGVKRLFQYPEHTGHIGGPITTREIISRFQQPAKEKSYAKLGRDIMFPKVLHAELIFPLLKIQQDC